MSELTPEEAIELLSEDAKTSITTRCFYEHGDAWAHGTQEALGQIKQSGLTPMDPILDENTEDYKVPLNPLGLKVKELLEGSTSA